MGLLIALGTIAAVVVVSVFVVGGISALYGFVAGIALSILCGYAAWVVVEGSGARAAIIGALGEDLTADELNELGRRWERIDSVPFGSIFDVDHVLIAEPGVFAVETKFTTHAWTEGSVELQRVVGNARWKARKMKLLLDRAGRPTVTPVLVIWGPGAPTLANGFIEMDGVLVCRGSASASWRAHLAGLPPTLDQQAVWTIAHLVRDHTERTERAHAR